MSKIKTFDEMLDEIFADISGFKYYRKWTPQYKAIRKQIKSLVISELCDIIEANRVETETDDGATYNDIDTEAVYEVLLEWMASIREEQL